MGKASGESTEPLVVVEPVKGPEIIDDDILVGVLDVAEEVFEVGEDGEEVGRKALIGHVLECSHLYSFPLVYQERNLFLVEVLLHFNRPFVATHHLLGERFQEFPVVDALVRSEGFEVVIVGHVQELELSQYVHETFLRILGKAHLLSLYDRHC